MKSDIPLNSVSVIGLFINAIYILTNRFVTVWPDWLAYPILFVDIALILVGVFISMRKKRTKEALGDQRP